MVALENDRGLPTTYMYTETVAVPKQIRGDGLGAGVFGTNFTFDDFERFMSLNRTEESKRLSDETREGHPSFVLVSTPRDPIRGSYTKVKTWVYGDQERVRRVLKADLDRIVTKDGLSYPGRITLRDLTEGTQTQLDITSSEIDGKLVSQGELEVGELGRYCR
ncbi:MAG TPA: outer membrane lipoprotein-sorting protein [Myxococcota bacterium]|nr:outer membrane lipoprotein-sorting protein [Myxococcota bacterium]